MDGRYHCARVATSKGRPFNADYICCESGGRSFVQYQRTLSFSEDAVAADRDGAWSRLQTERQQLRSTENGDKVNVVL
jgi:hypothetical protein